MNEKRHLLQYVHGLGARSRPCSKYRTRSGLATSGRAIVTPSQSPRSIARAITEAVWKPPVTTTGIETTCLTARESARLIPSISPSRCGRVHHQPNTLASGGVRNVR
jgi:hypothetical protein